MKRSEPGARLARAVMAEDRNTVPSAPARTIIDPTSPIARAVSAEANEVGCIDWRGQKICGPVVKVRLRLPPCGWGTVNAILAPLPRDVGAPVVLGADYLRRVRHVDAEGVICRRPRSG